MTAVPRHAHFIWLGEDIPDNRQACIDSFGALHPDWDVTVWRDVKDFGLLRNRAVFYNAEQLAPKPPRGNPWQVKTNVLRFEIMARHGGLFIDSDVTWLKPIDPLIAECEAAGKDGILGWEIQDRWLGEAVIACTPHAPFMERIITNLNDWAFAHARRPATVTVGPQYITPLLVGSAELDDVMVVDQDVFFPARHDQPKLSDAIAMGKVTRPKTLAVHRFGNFRRRNKMVWA